MTILWPCKRPFGDPIAIWKLQERETRYRIWFLLHQICTQWNIHNWSLDDLCGFRELFYFLDKKSHVSKSTKSKQIQQKQLSLRYIAGLKPFPAKKRLARPPQKSWQQLPRYCEAPQPLHKVVQLQLMVKTLKSSILWMYVNVSQFSQLSGPVKPCRAWSRHLQAWHFCGWSKEECRSYSAPAAGVALYHSMVGWLDFSKTLGLEQALFSDTAFIMMYTSKNKALKSTVCICVFEAWTWTVFAKAPYCIFCFKQNIHPQRDRPNK